MSFRNDTLGGMPRNKFVSIVWTRRKSFSGLQTREVDILGLMGEVDWNIFLKDYNRELLRYEQVRETASPEVLNEAWLGFPGASEQEIIQLESRIGMRLPPSYCSFLRVSNGWRFPSVFISEVIRSTKVTWFKEHYQDWIDAYVVPAAELPRLSDKEYLVYGIRQGTIYFRPEYLQTALQISEPGDSGIVLLNPKITTKEGEWETWFFANWLPGAIRYRSFAEWLISERLYCKKSFTRVPKSQLKSNKNINKPLSIKKAQAAARMGQTELALEALETLASEGSDIAAASLAELYAFLGKWELVIANAGRLIANPEAVYAGNVFNDMIQLLGRAGHHSGKWSSVIDVAKFALDKASHCQPLKPDFHRTEKVLLNLCEYAKRNGNPPNELLAIFGVQCPFAKMSRKEREDWYKSGVENVDTNRPDLKNNSLAKQEYFFSLAKNDLEEECIRIYEEYGKNFLMAWQAAEHVAPIYLRRGNHQAAWLAIESNISKWWPMDRAQVAPVILINDEFMHSMMTPERCLLVLSTPRGPEGVEKP
ncbi:MAG: hypothetical protein JWN25_740 [Verrucomicrobiales bacterium]|nr:hypothetical protein [Verrucomicrobiales bacterium]